MERVAKGEEEEEGREEKKKGKVIKQVEKVRVVRQCELKKEVKG